MRAELPGSRERLVALSRRWRARRFAAWVAGTLLLVSAAMLLAPGLPLVLGVCLLGVTGAVINDRRRPIAPITVARHLDRVVPAMEESAALLLDPPGAGDPMQRMQRRRAAEALASLEAVPGITLPATRTMLVASSAVLMLSLLVVLLPQRAPATSSDVPAVADVEGGVPLRIRSMRLQWQPPRYLGRPAGSQAAGNVTIAEASVVEWLVDADAAVSVRIVDLLGDTLPAQRTDDTWRATATVSKPRVWRAEILGPDSTVVRSETFLLAVTPDRPPVIAIVAPPGRTEMEWTEPHRVVVRAVVSDDHAIGSTALLATVAAGRGEGVRFRERRLTLERESSSGAGEMVVSVMVDLDALEVAPGDEVYLAVEASDRRAPQPQVSRSETVFLALRDTLDPVSSDFGGIAIDIEPEFFRSQRQIILDTEALLADIRAGRVREPLERAMDIGYDQYLLRVRYGEIAGQEDEANGTDPDATITEADLMHQHDTEDNATLLAASVKATLQGALSAMWEAEKQLRTGHPAEALPHEYRALVALEQIRQAQRAYVKRIGFEPPAIDVGRTRLTKDAKDLAPFDRRATGRASEPGGELRAALGVLDTQDGNGRAAALDAAARQLAALALRDATSEHLETLGALRRLLDGDHDASTRERVRRGLLAALPAPPRPIVPSAPR